MCLTLRDKNYEPYNESKIRWKAVRRGLNQKYIALYESYEYHKKKWNITYGKNDFDRVGESECQHGFHVFVTRKAARELAEHGRRIFQEHWFVKKIIVREFLASGTFKDNPSETWKQFKFV